MNPDESDETEPALETSTRLRGGPAHDSPGAARLGVRFVFPELRLEAACPGHDQPVVIGRDGDGVGRLDGTQVSRRHAELRLDGSQLLVRDLESRNGVFVNGEQCVEAQLGLHDVVRVGEWVAVVALATPPPESPPLASGASVPSLHLGPTAMQVAAHARRVAASSISVVLEGETGTGKERFARAIHQWSGRRGPLVALNCAALPESLAEAELFGYREGAFTGAVRASVGHFRAAHQGTLFLDEIIDMPLAVQAKLLRALEQKEVSPIGESRPVPVDVRVLAATQIPLDRAVAERRLRPDLRARLDGFTLRLPPLRERRDDVPSLFLHLLARHGLAAPRLSPRLVEALCLYDWPLNVRELDFVAQRLALLQGTEPILRRSHLPDRLRATGPGLPSPPRSSPSGTPTRNQLLSELANAGGNLARASERLGISRQKAYRLLGRESPERLKSARRPSS